MATVSFRELSFCAIAGGLFASCNGSSAFGPVSVVPASRSAANSGYATIYRFKGGHDGQQPYGDLLYAGGSLYGTTVTGGSSRCVTTGCGTIYSTSLAGKFRILYRFTANPDGAFPYAGLTFLKGRFYGVTAGGGSNYGTVFELTTSGHESTLFSFKGKDGSAPEGDLLAVNGKLYGTTAFGGPYGCYSGSGCGVVFEITAYGKEGSLHDFKGHWRGKIDGAVPLTRLTQLNGLMYGVTTYGGETLGTFFEISPQGEEQVLYRFKDRRDGAYPHSTLAVLNGSFYGTTAGGGVYTQGEVFEISPSGKERVLYAFKGPPSDGSIPIGNLLVVKGNLYGVTQGGGAHVCYGTRGGCGTIFELSTSGKEHILYEFKGNPDGAFPTSLTEVNGTLYGTTESGGGGGCSPTYGNFPGGCGTIFRITP